MHHFLGEQPGLGMVNMLVLGVLHPDVPPHAAAVSPLLPLEAGLDAQPHSQHRPAPTTSLMFTTQNWETRNAGTCEGV